MGIRILLLVALLIGLMYLSSWLGKASPAQRSAAIRNVIIYGTAATLLILVVAGRIPWIFAIAGAAAPWIQRALMAMRAFNQYKAFRGPAAGRQSNVNTAYLAMTLDHDSGAIEGEILAGDFKGQMLSSLNLAQLLELRDACTGTDQQSVPLIEAYIDQTHGTDWRADEPAGSDGRSGAGSVDDRISDVDALAILGLEEGASIKEIQAAHRRLMQKMHPDRGGSAYLAARINQARDVLIEQFRKASN
ncbi:MAG: molecular chaperone DnaJ [marine bacterium B5-7]|nr:MAG: molecular chaperone DnaJ [marine bacterium B5-7]